MKRLLLVLCLLLPTGVTGAEIYKWTDENGRVHFGDVPQTIGDTETVDLGHINTYNAPSKIFIDKTLSRSTGTSVFRDKHSDVIIYSTTWCGICVKAKNWLKANRIRFREYDVEKSPKGQRDYKKLKGRGVPIILVGQQRMNGFSPSRMRQMLKNNHREP